VEPDGIAALATVGAVAVPVVERPQSLEEAMAAGAASLERCGERLARLIGITASRPAPRDPPPRRHTPPHTPPRDPSVHRVGTMTAADPPGTHVVSRDAPGDR
jgi:hypothetical protein